MKLDQSNWYVLYTRPRHEKKIYNRLLKKNIVAFLPLIKVVRQWSDRKKQIEVPLFSNYLFVKLPTILHYQVLTIEGALKILHSNGEPASIDDDEIASIRLMMQGKPVVTNEHYQIGDFVKVITSPLKGLEGVLVEYKGKSRLSVRINVLNKSLLLNVNKSDLKKIQ